MNRQRFGLAMGVLATGLVFGALAFAQKTTAEALFREALMKERAEGKLTEAVFRYERLIAEFPKDRQYAAQALYQLALAYEKLGDPRAKLMLTRLSGDYAGVEPYATRARKKLAEQAFAPSGPFAEVALDENYELGSPDGRLVVYHKGPQDWGRLYVKELATGKERLLLDHVGKSVSNFAWSPDSSRLAFNLQDAKVNEIRIVQVATGETVSLDVRGYPYAWTDTDEIFFYLPKYAAGGIDYSLVSAKGGTPRNIYFDSSNFPPVITPDATCLIVTKSKKLYLLDLAGGEPRPLTTGTGEEVRPLISPDGHLVVFAANPEGTWAFYVVPLHTELPVKQPLKIANITEPGAGSGWLARQWWTREGLLTFGMQRDESNIYRVPMDLKSGRAVDAPQRLTQDAMRNLLPSISPDGKHIAYWYSNGTKQGIAMMDTDGANERPLSEQSAVLDLAWRGPEEILFYNLKPKEDGGPSICSINITTGALQQVAQVEGLYWTYVPSRKEILHLYPAGGGAKQNATLKAFSLTEQKDRVVAKIPYLAPLLCVSSDGRRIAALTVSPVEGTSQSLYEVALMSLDGEPEGTLIPAQPEMAVPNSWSPDGKYLLLLAAKGPQVMNVQTRESWPLHPDVDTSFNRRGTSWSPDGTYVLLAKSVTKRDRIAWEGVTAEAVAKLMAARR